MPPPPPPPPPQPIANTHASRSGSAYLTTGSPFTTFKKAFGLFGGLNTAYCNTSFSNTIGTLYLDEMYNALAGTSLQNPTTMRFGSRVEEAGVALAGERGRPKERHVRARSVTAVVRTTVQKILERREVYIGIGVFYCNLMALTRKS